MNIPTGNQAPNLNITAFSIAIETEQLTSGPITAFVELTSHNNTFSRKLELKESINHRMPFCNGNTDVFYFNEEPLIGKICVIRVWHESETASWQIKRVEVNDATIRTSFGCDANCCLSRVIDECSHDRSFTVQQIFPKIAKHLRPGELTPHFLSQNVNVPYANAPVADKNKKPQPTKTAPKPLKKTGYSTETLNEHTLDNCPTQYDNLTQISQAENTTDELEPVITHFDKKSAEPKAVKMMMNQYVVNPRQPPPYRGMTPQPVMPPPSPGYHSSLPVLPRGPTPQRFNPLFLRPHKKPKAKKGKFF